MTSGRTFFTILVIAFSALLAAIFAPASPRPSSQLLACSGAPCQFGRSAAVAGHIIPHGSELTRKKQAS